MNKICLLEMLRCTMDICVIGYYILSVHNYYTFIVCLLFSTVDITLIFCIIVLYFLPLLLRNGMSTIFEIWHRIL